MFFAATRENPFSLTIEGLGGDFSWMSLMETSHNWMNTLVPVLFLVTVSQSLSQSLPPPPPGEKGLAVASSRPGSRDLPQAASLTRGRTSVGVAWSLRRWGSTVGAFTDSRLGGVDRWATIGGRLKLSGGCNGMRDMVSLFSSTTPTPTRTPTCEICLLSSSLGGILLY